MAVAQHTVRFGRIGDLRSGRGSDFRSDKSLIRAAQGGKGEAATALIERHYPRVYSFVSYLSNGKGNAEDLAQEVFTRALTSLGTFNGRYQFQPWLLRIAKNLIIDESRKDVHRPSPTDPVELPEMEPVTDEADHVWNALSSQLASARVRNALSRLPVRQRTVLVLREIEEMSYADIAQIVGTNLRGVEGTLRRAKARFRLEATVAEGMESQTAVCKRTLRLIALDGDQLAPEAGQHLKICAKCRTKSSSLRKADALFAALPPLALTGLAAPGEAARKIAQLLPRRASGNRWIEAARSVARGDIATPLAQAMQVGVSVAVAGAVSVTAVAGYSQVTSEANQAVSFSPPAFAPVFDAEKSPIAAAGEQLPREPEQRVAEKDTVAIPPVPSVSLNQPKALVESVLDLLIAELPSGVSLRQLPLKRQVELLSELPDTALEELAAALGLPSAGLDKDALLKSIQAELAQVPPAPATGEVVQPSPSPAVSTSGSASGGSSSATVPPN